MVSGTSRTPRCNAGTGGGFGSFTARNAGFAGLLAALFALSLPTVSAATLPPGFTETPVATGISNPTSMQFAPDERLFVCQQTGALRIIKNGTLLATPFVTLSVNSSGERGLLGVTFDPNFAANHFVYIYYTAKTPNVHNRVSRFTANGDVALAGSEVILLELENLNATNHNGGAIHFGPDGKLYIAVGENAVSSNSQTLTNRLGKLLRINSDGTIPADNPFVASATGDNRSIWALGLRNPFTFAFQLGTGRLFINDVGQSTWEEINNGIAGANYGWPNVEGIGNNAAYTNPIFEYGHGNTDETGCSIIGATFYNPTVRQFPTTFSGVYFFGDYCSGWIRKLDSANGNAVTPFATGISSLVDLQTGADGSLYYLSRGDGSVVKISYAATVQGTVTLQGRLDATQPLTFTFRPTDGSGSFDRLVTPASNGTFTLSGLPAKDYEIHIKGSQWLAKNVTALTAAGQTPTLTFTLLTADANDDNDVNFDDFQILADAYFTTKNVDALYDARADFNGDNEVNFDDFQRLADNYFLSGDD